MGSSHTLVSKRPIRHGIELGYDIMVVKDATRDFSNEMMHAALDINIPNSSTGAAARRRLA